MLTVTILRTEDFTEDLQNTVHNILTNLIDNRGARIIMAGGDDKDMIYRLFIGLSEQYPSVCFSILLSNDKLAYESSDAPIFSLDCDIVYQDQKNAAKHRDDKLIKKTDILICRKGSIYDNIAAIRKNSNKTNIEIIAI